MGASASHSSPNLPSSYTLVKAEKTTRLFTVTDYSKWAKKRAGSVVEFDRFRHRDINYHLKVYPAGLDEESEGFVAVFVATKDPFYSFKCSDAPSILLEILDANGELAVFSNHTARSEETLLHFNRSKCYVRFVGWKELDESLCVGDDDTFTIRCTLSVDVEVTNKLTSPRAPPEDCCV